MSFLAEIVKSQFLNKVLKMSNKYGFSFKIRPVLCVEMLRREHWVPLSGMTFHFSKD